MYRGSESGIPKLIGSGLGGTDAFGPGMTDGLKKFPIGISCLQWRNGLAILHPLGLGSNSTYLNGSSGCWTVIKIPIAHIQVNKRDGSDASVFSSNANIPVCIVPQRQSLMEIPSSMVDKFEHTAAISN